MTKDKNKSNTLIQKLVIVKNTIDVKPFIDGKFPKITFTIITNVLFFRVEK